MTREELKQALDNLKGVKKSKSIIEDNEIIYNMQDNFVLISFEGKNGIRHRIWADQIRLNENENQYWITIFIRGWYVSVCTALDIENIRSIEVANNEN